MPFWTYDTEMSVKCSYGEAIAPTVEEVCIPDMSQKEDSALLSSRRFFSISNTPTPLIFVWEPVALQAELPFPKNSESE